MYYYEMSPSAQHLLGHSVYSSQKVNLKLMGLSDRAWVTEDTALVCIKHRHMPLTDRRSYLSDIEQFWIQMKAKEWAS